MLYKGNMQSQLGSNSNGQVQSHGGDQNLEMAPPSKKKLIMNKKLSKYVRLEQNSHGSKIVSKE